MQESIEIRQEQEHLHEDYYQKYTLLLYWKWKTLEEAIDSAKRAEVSVGYKKESDKRIRIVKEGKGKKQRRKRKKKCRKCKKKGHLLVECDIRSSSFEVKKI